MWHKVNVKQLNKVMYKTTEINAILNTMTIKTYRWLQQEVHGI